MAHLTYLHLFQCICFRNWDRTESKYTNLAQNVGVLMLVSLGLNARIFYLQANLTQNIPESLATHFKIIYSMYRSKNILCDNRTNYVVPTKLRVELERWEGKQSRLYRPVRGIELRLSSR